MGNARSRGRMVSSHKITSLLTVLRWDSLIEAKDFKITKLIEHPEQQAPNGEAPAPEAIGLYLTKKERKKMRRLNRKEVQKEEQEKIRLGLLPAPEPKVKFY